MSIKDENGNEIIRASTVWSWAFKLVLVTVPTFGGLCLAGVLWLGNRAIELDKEVALIKLQLQQHQHPSRSTTAQSAAAPSAPLAAAH